MKFETGLEQNGRNERKKSGKKLSGFEQYLDFNSEPVPELLELRKSQKDSLKHRSLNRRKKLEQEEAEGKLVTKI